MSFLKADVSTKAQRVGDIYGKAFTSALFLATRKLRNFSSLLKNMATVDAHGYVGFCVARSSSDGQCEGLESLDE